LTNFSVPRIPLTVAAVGGIVLQSDGILAQNAFAKKLDFEGKIGYINHNKRILL